MEIRQLTGLEQQQAHYIWSQSFERGDREMEEWKDWEARTPTGRKNYGIFGASRLEAAFLTVDETIYLGADATLPISAVCGVGVLPASRGKGHASAGMRHLFGQMRDQGQPISLLEPFSWDFYGKLGYAWTAPTRRYAVPTRVLKPSPETEHVRAALPEDLPAIIACYTRLAQRYRGMVVRRPEVWEYILDASKKEHTYTYLYERDGEVEGYLYYHGGKREETHLEEFITTTMRAARGMLGLLRRHEMQIDKFNWAAPSDELLWSTLVHGDIQTKLMTRHMARIVDVPAALRAIHPQSNAPAALTVAIQDDAAPWNQRTWRIEYGSGSSAEVKPTDAPPQVSLDIQALSQAYLGSPTVAELRASDRIQVHDETGFVHLQRLLTGPPAWCNDGF